MKPIALTTTLFLFLISRGYAIITCYCDDECSNTKNCSGVLCYARLILHINTNRHDFDFGCFTELDIRLGLGRSNSSGVCNGNVHKTGDDTAIVYKCCDNSDLCNKDFQPTIPSNLLYVTSTPTPSISPTSTPLSTTSTSTSPNLWLILLWTVTPAIIAINCGLFIILIIEIVLCCRKKRQVYREPSLNHLHNITFI